MLFNLRELIGIFLVPLVVFSVHAFLGLGIHIYQFWPWFDIPMHFAGGASIGFGTWVAFRILQRRGFMQNTPLLLNMFFLVSIVALAAVLWEFLEFGGDQLLGTKFFPRPLQGSIADTIADLALGLLGGAVLGWSALMSHIQFPRKFDPAFRFIKLLVFSIVFVYAISILLIFTLLFLLGFSTDSNAD